MSCGPTSAMLCVNDDGICLFQTLLSASGGDGSPPEVHYAVEEFKAWLWPVKCPPAAQSDSIPYKSQTFCAVLQPRRRACVRAGDRDGTDGSA